MADATNTTAGTIVLGGDLFGDDANSPALVASGVIPGTYSVLARTYVDSKGRTVQAGAITSAEMVEYVDNASYVARGVTRPGKDINIASTVLSVNTASATTKGLFTLASPLISTSGVASVDYTALAVATSSSKGIMQVGSGLSVAAGVLSRAGLTDATTSAKGIVKVGTNLSVSGGVLSFAPGDGSSSNKGIVSVAAPLQVSGGVVSIPYATNSVLGIAKVGSNINVASGVISLSLASSSVAGIAKIGSNLAANSGVVSLQEPDATTTSKGWVQVGSNIDVTSGTISIGEASTAAKGRIQITTGSFLGIASGVLSMSVPDATTSVKGILQYGTGVSGGNLTVGDATTGAKGVIQAGSGLSISSGTISVAAQPDATTASKGIIQVNTGNYLSISSGTLSRVVPDATTGAKGKMQVGSGLSVTGGTVSVALATASSKGIMQVGSGLGLSGNTISSSLTTSDATTSTKGIASFDSTYFNVSSALVSLKTATNTVAGVVTSADSTNISISAGAMNVGANVVKLNTANTFTSAMVIGLQTDTYTSTYAPDFSLSNTYEMVLTGNVSLDNPTNAVAGGVYTIILTQDGTGSRTLTLSGSGYKTNGTITLSTAPNARDVLTLVYKSATEIFVLYTPGF